MNERVQCNPAGAVDTDGPGRRVVDLFIFNPPVVNSEMGFHVDTPLFSFTEMNASQSGDGIPPENKKCFFQMMGKGFFLSQDIW
jgi:hypothetical protein